MLERDGQHAFDYQLHGGTAPMRMQWHFLDESQLPIAVQTWQLPPGGTEGRHVHTEEDQPLDEMYLIVDGTARMTVDDVPHDLGPGDTVLAPTGTEHDLVNTGDATLRVIVIWGPPAATLDWSRFGSGRAARTARAET